MFQIIGKIYDVPRELLEKVATATFSYLELTNAEIELKFVSVKEITRLNQVYRDKTGPTDVLSFTLDTKPLLGQIFICYTFTRDQAMRLGRTLDEEVALLLTHGILHVAGYDHEKLDEEQVMQQTESKILERVGLKR